MSQSYQQQIQHQEAAIAESRKRIAELRQKAKEKETRRLQRIADKVGFFKTDISDQALETALKTLVESTISTSDEKNDKTTS